MLIGFDRVLIYCGPPNLTLPSLSLHVHHDLIFQQNVLILPFFMIYSISLLLEIRLKFIFGVIMRRKILLGSFGLNSVLGVEQIVLVFGFDIGEVGALFGVEGVLLAEPIADEQVLFELALIVMHFILFDLIYLNLIANCWLLSLWIYFKL